MAPLSETTERRESIKIDRDLLKISEKLHKINITDSEHEKSTYNIDDDSTTTENTTKNTNELDNCTTIQEKGLISTDKFNNNRVNPYERDRRNEENNQILNQNLNQINNGEFFFNNFNIQDFMLPLINEIEAQPNNIPVPVAGLEFLPFQTNIAETALSNYIDRNKKLKQEIWILVNIDVEHHLLAKLKSKIASKRFNQTDLNYIYAIIIRLMKDDGRLLLFNYFLNDETVLFEIALKQNVLLMNFILEVYQNLGITPNQNVLHKIINHSSVIDLYDILNALINYKYNNMIVMDVNSVDNYGQSVLMVLLKNLNDVKIKYLDLILSQLPDLTYSTNDGKNIFHHANIWKCDAYIIQKIKFYYNESIVNRLMTQPDINGYLPCDYLLDKYQY